MSDGRTAIFEFHHWTCAEHVLNMCWTCAEHVLKLLGFGRALARWVGTPNRSTKPTAFHVMPPPSNRYGKYKYESIWGFLQEYDPDSTSATKLPPILHLSMKSLLCFCRLVVRVHCQSFCTTQYSVVQCRVKYIILTTKYALSYCVVCSLHTLCSLQPDNQPAKHNTSCNLVEGFHDGSFRYTLTWLFSSLSWRALISLRQQQNTKTTLTRAAQEWTSLPPYEWTSPPPYEWTSPPP
jgi:hypothetical protein